MPHRVRGSSTTLRPFQNHVALFSVWPRAGRPRGFFRPRAFPYPDVGFSTGASFILAALASATGTLPATGHAFILVLPNAPRQFAAQFAAVKAALPLQLCDHFFGVTNGGRFHQNPPVARSFRPLYCDSKIAVTFAGMRGRGRCQRAMACNGARRPWQIWHTWQCRIYKLWKRLEGAGTESPPLRQKFRNPNHVAA